MHYLIIFKVKIFSSKERFKLRGQSIRGNSPAFVMENFTLDYHMDSPVFINEKKT